MKDFADAGGIVAVLLEQLWQSHHVGQHVAKMSCVLVDAGRCRPATGHKRRPARIAERILTIGVLESHASAGKPIQMGRLYERITIAAEPYGQVIRDDEQHIPRSFSLPAGRLHATARDAKQPDDAQDRATLPSVYGRSVSHVLPARAHGSLEGHSNVTTSDWPLGRALDKSLA